MPYQRTMPSWESVIAGIQRIAKERGEWAGMPMPVKGLSMTIHPSYPFAKDFERTFMPEPERHVCHNSDIDEGTQLRNSFLSARYGCTVNIWRDSKGSFVTYSRKTQGPFWINTLMASQSWDMEAEKRARETLRGLIGEAQNRTYDLVGAFIETSKRSGVVYMFRRLRPTIAMTFNGAGLNCRRPGELSILCCLCSHPVGMFDDSWAGALTPSDDVISHLLLARADEHYFWRVSNQHPSWDPAAGL